MSEIEVDKITQKGTSGISITDDLKMSSGKSIQVDSIKHTDGTTAITINSDGSLSGKFEGAVKFKQIGRPSSGSPASGKTWITFAITANRYIYVYGTSRAEAGFGYGIPCAVYKNGDTWRYLDQSSSGANYSGQLSSSTPDSPDDTIGFEQDAQYTYTIEMDNV
jgi:hypothetical protein